MRVNLILGRKQLVVGLLVLLAAAGGWALLGWRTDREAGRQALVASQILTSIQSQDRDAKLTGAVEVDKVYLVAWEGSGPHRSLYIGGLLIDLNFTPK